MKTSKELREERASKYESLEALNAKRKADKRNFTDEEVATFETLETEIRTLNNDLKSVEAQERAEAITAARAAGGSVNGFSEKDEKDLSKYSLRKALLSLTGKNTRLEGIEAEMHQEAEAEMRLFGKSVDGSGLALPSYLMGRLAKRDISTSVGNGGYTIEDGVVSYVEALREKSLALQLGAGFMGGLTGNFDVPRENAVYVPGFKTENAAADESSPTLARASFVPKRLTGYMDVSKQLLVQSAVAIESYLRNQMLLGHAEALDKAAFQGAGSAEPVGILNDADVGVIAIGANGGAITKELVAQMIQALEEAKGMTDATRFIGSPILKKIMKALALDAGSGLFLWDKDSTVDGISAEVTTHVPKNIAKGSGTNLTALILGDLSNSMFGQWGGTEIVVDPYTQALNGMVRFVPAQYVDFHVIQPGRFQLIKDITTS
jgi:HK97 family phage major capsid protein